jgi:7-carboxy-7-deazaguanine synthase
MLNVSEIFLSIQGEASRAGRPCSFVRLFGCNLRCVWCDTKYARDVDGAGGEAMSIDAVIAAVESLYSDNNLSVCMPAGSDTGLAPFKAPARLVEITGGEPLLQPEVPALCAGLLALGYEVMAETNGSLDIGAFPAAVRRVIDVKCPGSGEAGSFLTDNIKLISQCDELKFVVASIDDAVWAKFFCEKYELAGRCPVIFSPVAPLLPYNVLAEWMLATRPLGVRMGIQLHKIIWGDARCR